MRPSVKPETTSPGKPEGVVWLMRHEKMAKSMVGRLSEGGMVDAFAQTGHHFNSQEERVYMVTLTNYK